MMASTVTKKNSLCRYFIRYGDCFHGENCQYIHAYPPQSSPQPQPAPHDLPPPTPAPPQQPVSQNPPVPQQQGYSMNKLICSFKSDLPNEIDFAMQVATLLANTDNFTWTKDYPLIDAICSSLHVFVCVCQEPSSCYCYPKFWHKILIKNADNQHLQAATSPPDMEISFLNFNSLEDHNLKDHTKIYRRIKSAAELIKQFSMTTGLSTNDKSDATKYNFNLMKKKKLKASPSLLKFVSLLLHSDDKILNLLGLDILSNTASKLSKIPESTNDNDSTKLVQMFQEYCIDCVCRQDGDIYLVNRSIEVVSSLISSSSRRVSSSIINYIIEKDLVLRVEQFLTSHYDITLFLSALECCYRISRHQPHLFAAGRTRYLMKILVNLLNCDDSRYFTPKALKRVKLFDEEDLTTHYLTPLDKPKLQGPPQPLKAQSQAPTQEPAKTPNAIPTQVQSAPVASVKEYTCEWNECNAKFTIAKQVYTHVFEAHIGMLEQDVLTSCLWSGPNGSGPGCLTKRPKFSLLTHLNDFHCNPVALERALNRSQPIKPPEHPGYAPNAALLAIRRHANAHRDGTNGSKNLPNQSPLSISVRLTAALILRNLATESPEMKHALENQEPLLSEICMTNGRDESKIIAECLSLFSGE